MYKLIVGMILIGGLLFTSCKTPSFESNVDKNLEVCKFLSNQDRDPNKVLSRKTLAVCKKVNSVIGKGYVAKTLYNLDRKEEADLIYNKINPKLIKECNKNGNSDACNILSQYYFKKKDSKKSIKFAKKSCELKNGIGCNDLAYSYSYGAGVKKDEYKATPLYKKSCEYGEIIGCTNLGLQYQYARGTEKKLEKSLLLYKEACNKDNGFGCGLLGYMYEKGEDFMKKDLNKAFSLYKKSCELNSNIGCKQAGNMLYKGRGVKKDKKEAFNFYLKACKLDDDISCKIVGDMYKVGEGVNKNTSKAKSFYTKACKLENGQACDILYPDRNKNRFKELLVIIGEEDKNNNFSPAKDIRQPFIEVKKGFLGDICLRSAIISNAFMNFEKQKKYKNELIKKEYYVDILIIRNKQEVAVVFKTKNKDDFIDDLPIIRYDRKDTDSIFNAFIKKLKEELKVDDDGVKKHKVSREILTLLFPKRFYEYLKER